MFHMMERATTGSQSTSWIGGLPKIPKSAWPKSDQTGLPLHFIAQIDLRAATDQPKDLRLPKNGWLAFFIDTNFEGTAQKHGLQPFILYVAEEYEFCEPPSSIPQVFGSNFDHATSFHADHPKDRFYRTPVNLQLRDWGDYQSWIQEVGASYNDLFDVERDGPPFRLAAKQFFARIQREFTQRPFYGTRERELMNMKRKEALIEVIENFQHLNGADFRAAVQRAGHFVIEENPGDALLRAREGLSDSREKIELLPSGQELLKPFLSKLKEIFTNGAPFEPMSMDEYNLIVEMGRATPFSNELSQGLPRQMRGVLAELAFGHKMDLSKFPRKALNYWNSHLFSARGPHLFAVPFETQPNLEPDEDQSILLLQVASDPVMGFTWGDEAAIQFWIPPENLIRHDWNGARARLGHSSMSVYRFTE
ncbi:DUF1963 domain-containing protein [Leisingera aquaemixtae]|nr:DUF1963 domain-containing protein [Leisingera aquaemixtae]